MDSESAVLDAIHRSAQAGKADTYKLLDGGFNTTALARPDGYDADAPSVLSRVPGVGLAYRLAKNWQREFSPRVYGDQAVLVKTSTSLQE